MDSSAVSSFLSGTASMAGNLSVHLEAIPPTAFNLCTVSSSLQNSAFPNSLGRSSDGLLLIHEDRLCFAGEERMPQTSLKIYSSDSGYFVMKRNMLPSSSG
ncbi:hypothetical protein GDO81_009287 [Engystomops pustulosus]|uniref:Uncharacterized protein n=1 Tax=Engystomops pustulosus TaxID=76066 RepID=A0AAV7BPY9_ENGPU|nr:hypothetical protein GDO81_009287 [Engystomops pustulosus]